jgi:hypothetical protein
VLLYLVVASALWVTSIWMVLGVVVSMMCGTRRRLGLQAAAAVLALAVPVPAAGQQQGRQGLPLLRLILASPKAAAVACCSSSCWVVVVVVVVVVGRVRQAVSTLEDDDAPLQTSRRQQQQQQPLAWRPWPWVAVVLGHRRVVEAGGPRARLSRAAKVGVGVAGGLLTRRRWRSL